MLIKRKCAADLEEYANNSKSIRLASSLTKASIAGVPVYQMQLGKKQDGNLASILIIKWLWSELPCSWKDSS